MSRIIPIMAGFLMLLLAGCAAEYSGANHEGYYYGGSYYDGYPFGWWDPYGYPYPYGDFGYFHGGGRHERNESIEHERHESPAQERREHHR